MLVKRLIYKILLKLCVTLPLFLSKLFSQRLRVENFHESMAIDSSLRDAGLVPKCGISCFPEDEVLSSLHGSATSQVTISFLCLLIPSLIPWATGAASSLW
jgi:hypothetical protein